MTNVRSYFNMVKELSNDQYIQLLKRYLKESYKALELGSGPGLDLDLLSQKYDVTGSDCSKEFKNLYQELSGKNPYQILDAIEFSLATKYDAIFSNKVMIHFSEEEILKSLFSQKKSLNDGGIVFHTFWRGNSMESKDGLVFHYYEIDNLQILFKSFFEIVEVGYYSEIDEEDSVYIVAKKRQ